MAEGLLSKINEGIDYLLVGKKKTKPKAVEPDEREVEEKKEEIASEPKISIFPKFREQLKKEIKNELREELKKELKNELDEVRRVLKGFKED